MVNLEVDRPKSKLDDNIKMDIRQMFLKYGLDIVGCALFSIAISYCSYLITAGNESEGIWKEKMVVGRRVYLPYLHLTLNNNSQPGFGRISSTVLREISE